VRFSEEEVGLDGVALASVCGGLEARLSIYAMLVSLVVRAEASMHGSLVLAYELSLRAAVCRTIAELATVVVNEIRNDGTLWLSVKNDTSELGHIKVCAHQVLVDSVPIEKNLQDLAAQYDVVLLFDVNVFKKTHRSIKGIVISIDRLETICVSSMSN